jgi:heme/copper-type cytochrome/quinol oxidase subunit 3
MSPTVRKLLVGAEDLMGVVALVMALTAAVTTWSPPPEATGSPPPAFGYIVTFALAISGVLFLLAARHLRKTGLFPPMRHIAPVLCVLAVPALGVLYAHL